MQAEEQIKILQLGKFYPIRGGVEKVMYDLMVGLSERQVHCDMLCASTEDYPSGDIILNAFATLMIVPTKLKIAATMLSPQLITRLRKVAKKYDIVHIHHPDPMATLALYLSGYKGKVVLHWHSDILKQKQLLLLYAPLQRWLIHRADSIVGTSPVYVKESPFLSAVQHKVEYIPIGIEPVERHIEGVQQIREKFRNRKIIFSLGRLVAYKGYEFLIKAAQMLAEDVHVVIGGKGPLKDELVTLIRTLGLEDKVTLIDFIPQEQVASYFHAADIFCLSSTLKTEAFAIVQIEAMSCGKPVVSTQIPGSGVSWVNKHEESGFTVPIADTQALGVAINRILNDGDRRQELSKGAKERYSALFTRKAMVDKSLLLYRNLLDSATI